MQGSTQHYSIGSGIVFFLIDTGLRECSFHYNFLKDYAYKEGTVMTYENENNNNNYRIR